MRSMLFAIVMSLAAVPVSAQPQPSRGTASVIGGFGKTFDDESSLGRGWLVGGAVDRVVFGTTRVEGSLEIVTHDRSSGYFLSNGRTIVGGGSLVQRFGRGDAQPYLFCGLAVGHHSGTNSFAGDSRAVRTTTAGFRGGFGVAFRAGDRLEISPEIRTNGFFTGDGSDPWMIPSFGVRLGWRM